MRDGCPPIQERAFCCRQSPSAGLRRDSSPDSDDARRIVSATSETRGWKRGISSRLRRIADTIHEGDDLASLVAPELPPPPPLPPIADSDDSAGNGRDRALAALITECYPTVAPKVLELVRDGAAASSDDWIAVARLLYDAHMHRVGGPTESARMRALVATFSMALEEQSRSSARLAGYHDAELDNASNIEGDPAEMLVWEHYLCPPAKLARQAIHGELVGDWLTALGELWAAAKALADRGLASDSVGGAEHDQSPSASSASAPVRCEASSSAGVTAGTELEVVSRLAASRRIPDAPSMAAATSGDTLPSTATSTAAAIDAATNANADGDDPLLARVRIALARVEELALW